MTINLIKNKQLFSTTLPESPNGQFWVTYREPDHRQTKNMISVEANGNVWVVKSNKYAWLVDNRGERVEAAPLAPMSVLPIRCLGTGPSGGTVEAALLFCEPVMSGRECYKKYMAKRPIDITIGRSANNGIIYNNPYVSSKHATLSFDGRVWSVSDNNSSNGTFVDGNRVVSARLAVGDCLYIMGLKIIIGSQYFAINNPDEFVSVKAAVSPFIRQPIERREVLAEIDDGPFFYRSPRFKRTIETVEITTDPPPSPRNLDRVPLGLMLGPALTMGVSSCSFAVFSVFQVVNNGAPVINAVPTVIMSVSMLAGSILWPLLTKKHERKRADAEEKKREDRYLNYLNTVRDSIKYEGKKQSEILLENHPSAVLCADVVAGAKQGLQQGLWGRMLAHDDFLRVRLGLGELPLDAQISYPKEGFSLDDDHLKKDMETLRMEKKVLPNVPIGVSLTANFLMGVIGERTAALGLVHAILLQCAALHSYDEVKMVLVYSPEEAHLWEYMRFMPHIWNNGRTARYLATNADEIKELSVLLENDLANRKDERTTDFRGFSPYYIVIAANKALFEHSGILQQQLKRTSNGGVSILMLYDELRNLPKETASVVQIEGGRARLFHKDDIAEKPTFAAELVDSPLMRRTVDALANTRLDLAGQQVALPSMLTFLEMFNVGKVEHLNALTRWEKNNPTVALQTPIGVGQTGELLYLDLHESFQGPHGLIAGTTGSGKSEFIITYILSMAVNFHPNEVAFVLIDYKGGGMAGAFESEKRNKRLPHLAGVITNLEDDNAALNRSLVSINSELKRRQAVFKDACEKTGEGTMDIYKYQKLYREGRGRPDGLIKKPMPHLFIISDEFAELKAQQPEFMAQLISAARIGRSLGVHLILATQKPAGAVDPQIWSNSRFRICLKVQEKEDLTTMIKSEEAVMLQQTGRFYLQVGYNELLAMGQSAWCGAEYVPKEQAEKKVDDSVQVVNNLGRVIKEEKPPGKESHKKAETTQIVSLVEYLSDLAKDIGVKTEMLWLPPIPGVITVDALAQKYPVNQRALVLNPIIGEYDAPEHQEQRLLTLPLTEGGNCIVYGVAGSGRELFLTTAVYSLLSNHNTASLNLYILDFGAETLRAFEKAPQVGDVVLSAETDKIKNLFKMLSDELANRRKLFADYGGDYQTYCKDAQRKVPNIVVVLNNYNAFAEMSESRGNEGLMDAFLLLSQDGTKYGLFFILSVTGSSAMRFRQQQNFKQVFVLQLNDTIGYSTLLNSKAGILPPSRHIGRGLTRVGNDVYEFQTAHYAKVEEPFAYLQQFSVTLAEKDKTRAKKSPHFAGTFGPRVFKPPCENPRKCAHWRQQKNAGTHFCGYKRPLYIAGVVP